MNYFYFACSGWYNGIKFRKWFNAKVRTSRELWYIPTYLLFRPSPLPQPFCPEGWLNQSFLSVKKNPKTKQNSLRTFCIERLSLLNFRRSLFNNFIIQTHTESATDSLNVPTDLVRTKSGGATSPCPPLATLMLLK